MNKSRFSITESSIIAENPELKKYENQAFEGMNECRININGYGVGENFDALQPQQEQAPRMTSCGNFRDIFLVSNNSRIYNRVRQVQRGVEEERHRHLITYPSTIHPYSNFRWYWDIFMTLVLVLTLISQPLQIAFYPKSMEELSSAIVGLIACIIFSVDIYFNFRTGYVEQNDDDVVLEPRAVAVHYFKTWFIVDLISTIPFDSIYVAINDVEGDGQLYFRYFRLLELFKIFRLARVIRYLGRIERAFEFKSINSRVINLVIMMLFLIHWLGCMHYLVADMANSPPYARKKFSWVSQMDLWDRPVWEKYAHCVLRGLSNMACLGYGFVTPNAPEDVLCTLVSIMIGATCFAMFIASMASIVLSLDSSHKKYLDSLNQVISNSLHKLILAAYLPLKAIFSYFTIDFMNFKHIPKPLQTNVISYYEQRYRRNLFNENEIMDSLSDVLRQKVQMHICHHLVEQVPLFRGIGVEILYGIVGQLKPELYLPNDVIIAENTIGTCMYFIEKGNVQVLGQNGEVINQLGAGNFFGEMALVTNQRRSATIVAKVLCNVYRLEKADFEKVILQYPEIYQNIVKVAKDRERQKRLFDMGGKNNSDERISGNKPRRPTRTSIEEINFDLIPS